jgi:hypothetical protein
MQYVAGDLLRQDSEDGNRQQKGRSGFCHQKPQGSRKLEPSHRLGQYFWRRYLPAEIASAEALEDHGSLDNESLISIWTLAFTNLEIE